VAFSSAHLAKGNSKHCFSLFFHFPDSFFLQFQRSRMATFHSLAALLEVSLSQLVIFHSRFIVFVMPVYLVVLS